MIKKLLVACVVAVSLSGCVPILLGSAAVAGSGFFLNYRSGPQATQDGHLQDLIQKKLDTPQFNKSCNINVNVMDGNVLLTGQCPTKSLKMQAERLAATATGINELYNEINVEGPTSYLVRTSDDLISTRIKLNLINRPELKTAHIQVIVEEGVVYLMGTATKSQQSYILKLVKEISGVQKIVNIFNVPQKQIAKISKPKSTTIPQQETKQVAHGSSSQSIKKTSSSANGNVTHYTFNAPAGNPNPNNSLSGP
jgi:osmotically-inducible protein OsmY